MARKARGASPGKTNRQVPGWVWLFTGVVTGLFVAFLVHLASIAPREAPEADIPARVAEQATDGDEDGGPSFDFYAVLPQMEVILPRRDEEADEATGRDAPDSAPPPATTPGDRGEAPEDGESYMLQAGSFRSADDAEQRRAELILQGFEVRVQSVELDQGEHWHRVMIGPFHDSDSLHSARERLAEGGIEVLPIRAVSPEG